MDIVLIELVLWGGLLFFFWALKDGLGRVETEIEASAPRRKSYEVDAPSPALHFSQADRVTEQIGSYKDAPIYRFAVVNGQQYQFDYVLAKDKATVALRQDECCLSPGLIYVRCGNEKLISDCHAG